MKESRFDRWNRIALALILLGTLVRALHAYPPHEFPNGADS
jgi:hypothetical protein